MRRIVELSDQMRSKIEKEQTLLQLLRDLALWYDDIKQLEMLSIVLI